MSLAFISYRRRDALNETRKIHDKLQAYFGRNTVFLDESAIEKGKDWKLQISQAVGECEVVLVVIGERWSSDNFARDDDMVRFEISTALRIGRPIVPVLLDGTQYPEEKKLSPDMRGLVSHQGLRINTRKDDRYAHDIAALIDAICSLASPSGTVVLRRAEQKTGALGDVQVFLDGQLLETLRPGDVKLKSMHLGDHEIYGTMTTAILLRAARTTTIRFRVRYKARTSFLFKYDWWTIDPLVTKENSLLKIEERD